MSILKTAVEESPILVPVRWRQEVPSVRPVLQTRLLVFSLVIRLFLQGPVPLLSPGLGVTLERTEVVVNLGYVVVPRPLVENTVDVWVLENLRPDDRHDVVVVALGAHDTRHVVL